MGHFPYVNFLVSIPYGIAKKFPESISKFSKLDD